MGDKTLLLLVAMLFVVAMVLNAGVATSIHHRRCLPGSRSNVSEDDRHLKEVVLIAAHKFNNQSNDMFLFKPSAVRGAQRQIVNGLRYIVDVDVSRTVCRKHKANMDLTKCELQPPGRLQQVVGCHGVFWLMPWINETKTQSFFCKKQ